MPLLRGNLHAHTTFSDGVRSPALLVREYEALGYDFLAITDHEDHQNLVEPAYRRALDALESDLVLLRGIELNFAPLSQHVGRLVGERETLYVLKHPGRNKLAGAETIGRSEMIRRAGWPVEAVEVTDTGLYRPLYDSPDMPVVRIATDDAHRPPHFGRAWVEVEASRDADSIIRAIRAGDFRIGFARP